MSGVSVQNLSVWLGSGPSPRLILDEVTLQIPAGRAVGLVGESGSGKSTIARSILRALAPGRVTGKILFDGQDIYQMTAEQLRELQTGRITMIDQNPRAAMNPVRRVGDYATEVLRTSRSMSMDEARAVMANLLSAIGIHYPERVLDQYPNQLSGGMLQRVVIAAALAIEPQLLIADEPTTALDVTTQSEVMAILVEEAQKRQMSLLFITHDLDLVAAVTNRTAVMYAGKIVEEQASERLLQFPQHPYTRALAAARTRADVDIPRLEAINGNPIAAYEAGQGCSFAPRCHFVTDECLAATPPTFETQYGRVACIHYQELDSMQASTPDEGRLTP